MKASLCIPLFLAPSSAGIQTHRPMARESGSCQGITAKFKCPSWPTQRITCDPKSAGKRLTARYKILYVTIILCLYTSVVEGPSPQPSSGPDSPDLTSDPRQPLKILCAASQVCQQDARMGLELSGSVLRLRDERKRLSLPRSASMECHEVTKATRAWHLMRHGFRPTAL
jgi:hypothetical protein